MKSASLTTRWLTLLLAGLISLGACPAPVQAAESVLVAAPSPPSAVAAPAVIFAGFIDYFTGSRQRMVQFAFVGFTIGVAILVTATRKR